MRVIEYSADWPAASAPPLRGLAAEALPLVEQAKKDGNVLRIDLEGTNVAAFKRGALKAAQHLNGSIRTMNHEGQVLLRWEGKSAYKAASKPTAPAWSESDIRRAADALGYPAELSTVQRRLSARRLTMYSRRGHIEDAYQPVAAAPAQKPTPMKGRRRKVA